jgi:hypothetical protein
MTKIDGGALVVAPGSHQYVGHHHHQGSALGQLLVHAEHQRQDRDGDQAAADAENAPQGAHGNPERQVLHYLDHFFP